MNAEAEKRILGMAAEKQVLIEKLALQCLLEAPEPEKLFEEAVIKAGNAFVLTHTLIDGLREEEEASRKATQTVVVASASRECPAKDIEADIRIYRDKDVTEKSTCTGTIGDFVAYFRDRFTEMKGILKTRQTQNGVVESISKLKSYTERKPVRIIGLVSDKRETKNGHLLIEVEDEEATLPCLVPKDSPIKEKARGILLDEVIALDGYLSNSLFIVAEITWPDIPIREKKPAEEEACIAFLSDLHIGSKYFLANDFQKFLRFINGEGDSTEKEIAGKIKYVVIAGDLVDGIGVYPTQEKQLVTKDIYTQYQIFNDLMKSIPDHVHVIISPGNHDAVRNAEPQPRLLEEFTEGLEGKENIHFVGNPAYLELHGVKTLVYHGTSLDTIIANMNMRDGYSNPEKVGIEMLKRRHLSPLYGEKPIVPEHKDYMIIKDVPDIFHFGHVHKNGYAEYRGVTVVNSGAWQDTTDYQQKMGHVPSPCQLPVYNLKTQQLSILDFRQKSK